MFHPSQSIEGFKCIVHSQLSTLKQQFFLLVRFYQKMKKKTQKWNDFGVFQSLGVRKKILKIPGFLQLVLMFSHKYRRMNKILCFLLITTNFRPIKKSTFNKHVGIFWLLRYVGYILSNCNIEYKFTKRNFLKGF